MDRMLGVSFWAAKERREHKREWIVRVRIEDKKMGVKDLGV